MQYIILIRGPLGAGKTTVAKDVAKQTDAAYFSIDRILEELQLDKSDSEAPPAYAGGILSLFENIHEYDAELRTLLTENFRVIGVQRSET